MSILLHNSLRGISPQRFTPTSYCAQSQLVCGKEEGRSCSGAQSKRFASNGGVKSLDKDLVKTKSSEKNEEKVNKISFTFSSWGLEVPLRLSEINKLASKASEKLSYSVSRSKLINNLKANNEKNNESKTDKKITPNSFEDSLNEMNRCISSFYDTSDAVERKVEPRELGKNTSSANISKFSLEPRPAPSSYHTQLQYITSKDSELKYSHRYYSEDGRKNHDIKLDDSKDENSKEVDKNLKEEDVKDKPEQSSNYFSSWGVDVPLKIMEMNKLISDASQKLVSNFKTNSNSNDANGGKEVQPPHSIEQSLMKMNQSIESFYDTTYATNSTNVVVKRIMSQEAKEDDVDSEVPKRIEPLFPKPKLKNPELKRKRAAARREQKISRLSLESRTRALVVSLKSAHSLMSKITRAEELCEHLIAHPECVWDASAERVVPVLQQLTDSPNKQLRGMAYETLSLLGHVKTLTSPGVRVLSIDGGGTRGLVTIEFLKALEKQTGQKTYQLFDYVCGVSTGALLAILICLYKLPLDICEKLYKECSKKMFTRSKFIGTTKLVWTYGFYDSQSWEELLRKEMGEISLIEFARNPECPKLSAVSSLMGPQNMKSHLFRTYNPPPGSSSQYPGSCSHKVWQVVRASSAAPGYFESFRLGDEVHEDGGILTNNPTALAIHESRLLWPNENMHCVVSLGTGRYDSVVEFPEAKVSLRSKLTTIVNSATDTEAVHQTLSDLLPAGTYFRFNPYLSEEFLLDEIRPEKMHEMQLDAQMYARRNDYKLKAVSQRLMEQRKPQQVARDWVKTAIEKNFHI